MLNLNQIFDGAAFALDPRSIEETLRNFKAYVALIPFDADNYWDKVFFPHGDDDIAILAARYRSPELADGELPPQQGFLLAFLRQLETPKALLNDLPDRHRQLYYRELLGLTPHTAQPDQVAVSFELSSGVVETLLPAGTALDGGQDSQGQALRYLLDAPLQANAGRLSGLHWARPAKEGVLRHTIQSDALPFPEGGVRLFAAQDQEQVAATGRVVAAEILALSSGQRTFSVTFAEKVGAGELRAAVSTDKGWLNLPTVTLVADDNSAVFTLAADQAAIVPPQGLDGFNDPVPLLKLSRADGKEVPAVTKIEASTTQPSDIVFSTQDGVAQPDQPCLPFGAEPLQGACVRLMAPDWCRKSQAITVTLTPEWQQLPEKDFKGWYQGYTGQPANNEAFTVTPQQLTANGWETLKGSESLALFEAGNGAPKGMPLSFCFPPLTGAIVDSADPTRWNSQLRLVLEPQTFLHQEYWQQVSAGETKLNPPYTPQWAGLAIAYASAQDIASSAQYRLTPFGHQAAGDTVGAPAQPQLYLGLEAMQAGQQLSLYWKLQSPQPLSMDWQYLNIDNRWAPLNASVLDKTGGLFESGLWSATLPADASDQAAQMPAGSHWLRAVMTPCAPSGGAESDYPQLQGLLANAMTATLAEVDTVAVDHFAQALPAGSVTQTVESLAGLAGMTQAWPSQGGLPPETPDDFNRRVASQLQHRGRALRRNDLHALLREQFPEVGAVILPEDAGTPGEQALIAIPAAGLRDNDDARRPAFNPARLARMSAAMRQRTSPWAEISVKNPQYRIVDVSYQVEFVAAVSDDYGYRQLSEALSRQYIPWAWQQGESIQVGNQLDYYQLLHTIQAQPYVKTVTALTLDGGQQSVQALPGEVLLPGMPETGGISGFSLTPVGEKRLRFSWNKNMDAERYALYAGDSCLASDLTGHEYTLPLDTAWQYPEGTVFKLGVENNNIEAPIPLSQRHLRGMRAILTPSDMAIDASYGQALALSSDGCVAAVSAPALKNNLGAVYLFKRENDGWKQGQKLVGMEPQGRFGESVCLSGDGRRLAVSAAGASQGGRVYIFDVGDGEVYVKTHEWDGVGSTQGSSLSMSRDGKRVAASAQGADEKWGVYFSDFNGGGWSDFQGVDLESNDASNPMVRISGDGSVLAVVAKMDQPCTVYRMSGNDWEKDNEEDWFAMNHGYYPGSIPMDFSGKGVVIRGHEGTSKGVVYIYNKKSDWTEVKCKSHECDKDYNRFGSGMSAIADNGYFAVTYDNDNSWNGFEIWHVDDAKFVAAIEMAAERSQAGAAALDGAGKVVLINTGKEIAVY
ncbi:hypothetical protein [Chromobacterium haemolyticum]|uniref:hypothetical protein n=1 Tax=Chromobacterium haemolyticum TaxID=394935 RepID=UPI0009DA2722|nr:hypothetical protein [Chromobacterium haemolyticum]OQS37541.1 hypothetical protein B0T39_15275 [Chromobacterium haemolyticum]